MKDIRVLSLGVMAMDTVLSVSELPRPDDFGFIESERTVPGGSASNASVAMVQLGLSVRQAGKIGDDHAGEDLLRSLVDEGVDVSPMVTKRGGTTFHTYIFAAAGGEHCIFANTGDAVTKLEASELPSDVLDGVDVLYTDFFVPKAGLYLARQSEKLGIKVVFNLQCPPLFMERIGVAREEIEEMMALSNLFLMGRAGYEGLCGGGTGEEEVSLALSRIFDRFGPADGVVLTCGEDGAFWRNGEETLHGEAYPVTVADTTGAGDCFTAGLICGLYAEGMGRADALRYASAAAALKCMQHGPRVRASREEVLRFIEERERKN